MSPSCFMGLELATMVSQRSAAGSLHGFLHCFSSCEFHATLFKTRCLMLSFMLMFVIESYIQIDTCSS